MVLPDACGALLAGVAAEAVLPKLTGASLEELCCARTGPGYEQDVLSSRYEQYAGHKRDMVTR